MLKRVLAGFVIGFVAVLTFHQATVGILNAYGVFPAPPFRLTPTGPLGVPAVFNAAFWGGIWGIVILLLTDTLRRNGQRLIAAILIGAVGTTAVAWFVVAPLKGLPVAQGWNYAAMWRAPLVNGMFGLGCAVLAQGICALLGAKR